MPKKVTNKRKLDDSYFKNIPGHYYDEKKKRLFKLAGNEFSALPGVLTKEKIKEREIEDKRVKDLLNDLKSCNDKSNIKSMSHLLYQREMNAKTMRNSFSHEINSSLYSNLRCQGYVNDSKFIDDNSSIRPDNITHIKSMVCGPLSDSLTVLLEGTKLNSVKLVMLDYAREGISLEKDGIVSDSYLDKLYFSTFGKISFHMNYKILAYKFHDIVDCTIFANSSLCIKMPSQVYLARDGFVNALDLEEYIFSGAVAGKEMFAIGSEHGVNLYDVQTQNNETIKPIRKLNSNNCQVHATAFSKDNKTLYYGDLHGHIRFCDLKDKHVNSLMLSERKGKVDSLYECQDDNYLLTSFTDGRILMLDRRMKKTVLSYQDHKNDYMKIPIQINQSEEYMAAVGTDCYTRIWDLKTSRLLRSIPPPIPSNRSIFPVVCFVPGNHLSQHSYPQLLLSIGKQIFVYS